MKKIWQNSKLNNKYYIVHYMGLETKKRWISQQDNNKYNKIVYSFGWALAFLWTCTNLIAFLNPILNEILNNNSSSMAYVVWFSNLGTFTNQSNWICSIVLIMYLLRPRWKMFKNYNLIATICAYITITFIGYNFFIGLRQNYSQWSNWSNSFHVFEAYSSIWQHVFGPILFVVFFVLEAKNFRDKYIENSLDIGKRPYSLIGWGLIYPMIFLLYALLISLVNKYVVYNGFTNINSNFGYLSKYIPWEGNLNTTTPLLLIKEETEGLYTVITEMVNKATYTTQQLADKGISIDSVTFGKLRNLIYFVLFIFLFIFFLFMYKYCFMRRLHDIGWKPRSWKQDYYIYKPQKRL